MCCCWLLSKMNHVCVSGNADGQLQAEAVLTHPLASVSLSRGACIISCKAKTGASRPHVMASIQQGMPQFAELPCIPTLQMFGQAPASCWPNTRTVTVLGEPIAIFATQNVGDDIWLEQHLPGVPSVAAKLKHSAHYIHDGIQRLTLAGGEYRVLALSISFSHPLIS